MLDSEYLSLDAVLLKNSEKKVVRALYNGSEIQI